MIGAIFIIVDLINLSLNSSYSAYFYAG